MSLRALGVDPGRNCALAVVEQSPNGPRPRVVKAWEVHGADHLWYPRIDRALLDAAAIVSGPHHDLVAAWVEDWRPVARGDRKLATQFALTGLGRRQGAVLALWTAATGTLPALVPVTDDPQSWKRPRLGWATYLGLPGGKKGDGTHRIQEAHIHVEGADVALGAASNARRIDVAEALLIACAAYHWGRNDRRMAAAQAQAQARKGASR